MPLVVRHQLWLALIGLGVFFTNLGAADLFDEDEPKNAACAYEMLVRGDWVVPSFNHELRPEKPVLLYWLMMLAYRAFGVTEFAARFWSATLALGTVLATYHLGRRLFQPEVGFWGALALATALMFDVVARAATPDSTLVFFITWGMLAYVCSVGKGTSRPWEWTDNEGTCSTTAGWHVYAPRRTGWWIVACVSFSLAVLTKGPIGVLLPWAILTSFYLVVAWPGSTGRTTPPVDWFERLTIWFVRTCDVVAPRRVGHALLGWRPGVALGVLAVLALPWYVAVGLQTEGRWLAGFLGQHNVGRFLSPMENHSGPFFYYAVAILIGFFPWSVFLSPCLLDAWQRIRAKHAWRAGYVLLACWAGVWVVFFTLARTKLPNYVLPAYPALALLTGAFVQHWRAEPRAVHQRLVRWSIATLALSGGAILIGLGLAGMLVLEREGGLGFLGLVPLVGAMVAWWSWQKEQVARTVKAVAAMSVVFAVVTFGLVSVRVSRYHSSADFIATTRAGQSLNAPIAAFDYFEPSLVYYARDRVDRLDYAEVSRYFDDHSERYLLVFEDQLDQLWPRRLPEGVKVLDIKPRFLRRDRIALLGRPPLVAGDPSQSTRR